MSFFSRLFHTASISNAPSIEKSTVFVIGLGNPGKKYASTRHNLGFLALDRLRQSFHGSDWQLEKKFQAEISEASHKQYKLFLVKPQTFMNNSGESVQKLLTFYKASPKDIIVLHDEVDIPFGKIKTTLSSRAAGHNGVRDIIEKLGTQDFRRIRLGVGKPARNTSRSDVGGSENPNVSLADHVLQNFSPDETEKLPTLFEATEHLLEKLLVE